MLNETELINEVKRGNEMAFKNLYNLFCDRVYNTALSILQQQQDAEDITQEVFVEVHRSIHQFLFKSSLQTWLYTITVNKCNDLLRKQKAKKRFAFVSSIFGEDNSLVIDKPHFNHPGVALENKEHAKVLFAALEKLPTQQKTAFTLVKIEGLAYQHAAEIMQVSLSAFESLMVRANKNLKASISGYYKNNIQSGEGKIHFFLLM